MKCLAITPKFRRCKNDPESGRLFCYAHTGWLIRIVWGAIIACVALGAGISQMFDVKLPNPLATDTPIPTFTSVVMTEAPSGNSDISIVRRSWDGTYFNMPTLTILSCKDSENIFDNGPKVYVIYTISVTLTFKNNGKSGGAIYGIQAEPVTALPHPPVLVFYWHVSTPDTPSLTANELLIDLPVGVSKNETFSFYHAVQTSPNTPVKSIYDDAISLSPLVLHFKTGDQGFTSTSNLYIDNAEALNNSKYIFEEECKDLVPQWPLSVHLTTIVE